MTLVDMVSDKQRARPVEERFSLGDAEIRELDLLLGLRERIVRHADRLFREAASALQKYHESGDGDHFWKGVADAREQEFYDLNAIVADAAMRGHVPGVRAP